MKRAVAIAVLASGLGAALAHECSHESMQARMDAAVPPETMASAVPYRNPSAHVGFGDKGLHTFDVEALRAEAKKERAHLARSRQLLAEFSGIRILVDFTLVDGPDEDDGQSYRCNAAGDTVPLSESTSQMYTCTEADVLTASKRSYLKSTLMAEAEAWLEGALQVNPVDGSMYLAPFAKSSCDAVEVAYACCQQFQPFTTVEDQDFVLFVTGRPTSGATIAWALSCASDQYGRPVSGHANFGPARLSTSSRQRSKQVGTAIHEVMHALGFSSGRYKYFRKPDNGDQWGESNVVETVTENGHTVTKIITPAVVEKAKEHYGCDNWPNAGLQLEDAGGSGTAGSHWEKRLLRNEIMTGTANHLPVYSAMTLALFEDMGWYTVDYAYAQELKWGLDQGCSFPTDQCSSWSERFFCDGSPKEGCTHDFTAVARCNVKDFGTSLPSPFQYFSDPAIGGRDWYADYCPYFEAYSNGDCRDLGPSETPANSILGETIDASSRCFVGTAALTGPSSSNKPRCLETRCDTGFLKFSFSWDSKWHQCPQEGGTVTTGQGTVDCPAFQLMCADQALGCPSACSGHGECLQDAMCSCSPGFSGSNCSIAECPKTDGVECSGHGQCDSSTGECACDTGFLGDGCSEPVCSGSSTGGDECSGHGSCNSTTALCDCDASYYGDDCSMRQCLQPCNGTFGGCDTAHGACACNILPQSSQFHSGPDCNGGLESLPVIPVEVVGNISAKNSTHTVQPRRYAYFVVDVDNLRFDVTITAAYSGPSAEPVMYGSFEDTPPTAADHGKRGTLDAVARTLTIVLCGTDSSHPSCSGQLDESPIETGTFFLALLNTEEAGGADLAVNVTATQDPCVHPEMADCSGHGTCDTGKCTCSSSMWTDFKCSSPNCPGDPNCLGRGECKVEGNVPTCECDPSGIWTGADCGTVKDGVDLEEASSALTGGGAEGYGSATFQGVLDATENQFFRVKLEGTNSSRDGLFLRLTRTDELSDPMLLLRHQDTPTIAKHDLFDARAWTQGEAEATLVLDASTGSRKGEWFVSVVNNVFARGALQYTLHMDVVPEGKECPAPFDQCSGHGTCQVSDRPSSPSCLCQQSSQVGNTSYAGTVCDIPIHVVGSGDVNAESVPVGGWYYGVIEPASGSDHVRFEMESSPSPGAKPLLLVRSGGVPELTRRGKIDYQGMELMRNAPTSKQVVEVSGEPRWYFAVHNRVTAAGPLHMNVSAVATAGGPPTHTTCEASNEAAAASVAAEYGVPEGEAAKCKETDADVFCSCRGTCITVNGVAKCQCTSSWDGTRCSSPKLRSLQQLLTATQSIGRLCNVCEDDIEMERDQWRLFRVPQPLQKDTGLNLSVIGDTNTTDADLYVSEVLPRSVFDFTRVVGASGDKESLLLRNRSQSGRFWLGVYAKSAGTYRVGAGRQELPNDDEEVTFMEELFKWATTTPAGNATLFVAGIVLVVICLGCCWQQCSSQHDKQLTQETVRSAFANMGSLRQLPRFAHPTRDVHPSHGHLPTVEAEMTGAGAGAGGRPNSVSNPMAGRSNVAASAVPGTHARQPVHAVSQPPGVQQQTRWTAQATVAAPPPQQWPPQHQQPPPPPQYQSQPPPPPGYPGNNNAPGGPQAGRRTSAAPALDPRLMAALHQGPR